MRHARPPTCATPLCRRPRATRIRRGSCARCVGQLELREAILERHRQVLRVKRERQCYGFAQGARRAAGRRGRLAGHEAAARLVVGGGAVRRGRPRAARRAARRICRIFADFRELSCTFTDFRGFSKTFDFQGISDLSISLKSLQSYRSSKVSCDFELCAEALRRSVRSGRQQAVASTGVHLRTKASAGFHKRPTHSWLA